MVLTHPVDHRMWFAVYTKSHHEKNIARQLSHKGIDHYLPLYRAEHTWTHRRRVTLDLPLFPNYLFVHILPSERSRVLSTDGVVMLIDRGDVITPVPDAEIERLRAELHLRASEPHSEIAVGQKGRIVAGPLAGMEGIVLRHKGDLRLILTVPLINRSVAVEVNADEVMTCDCDRVDSRARNITEAN
jgi:transcription antitermination factor NusG